jgi:hypothetical protein
MRGKFIAHYISVFLSCVEPSFSLKVFPKVYKPLKITSVRSVENSGCTSRFHSCRQSVFLHFKTEQLKTVSVPTFQYWVSINNQCPYTSGLSTCRQCFYISGQSSCKQSSVPTLQYWVSINYQCPYTSGLSTRRQCFYISGLSSCTAYLHFTIIPPNIKPNGSVTGPVRLQHCSS